MRTLVTAAILVAALVGQASAQAPLVPYSQDFELMLDIDPFALADDNWLVYGNVFDPAGGFLYNYGPFPAPNHNLAFSQVVLGQSGPEQGLQTLVVFNDYEAQDAHLAGNFVESNVYREWTVPAEAAGQVWTFQFDAKRGDIDPADPLTSAFAFIKTLDPTAGYFTSNFITADMQAIPDTWGTYTLDIGIFTDLVGQLIQIGFVSTATNSLPTAVFYDNIIWSQTGDLSAVPEASTASLGQNYPNPFNPMTRIDFALEEPGMADVSVYDLAGRLVATLHHGDLGAGEHHVMWDGRTDAGAAVAAGQYRYVLTTAGGKVSRSMILLK
jgi:hypothetical protein